MSQYHEGKERPSANSGAFMQDLTKGKVGKQIFLFALPMLIGNLFQQLYSTVDSIIVGKFIGKEALAAVGASFAIIFMMLALLMGFAIGAMVLISQYYGAKKMDEVKKVIDTTYVFLFFAAIVMTIGGILLSGPLLRLMKVPPDVFPQAQLYLNITFGGIITMFGYNSASSVLRGLGDSKTPLIFIAIATVINIVLDIVFVRVFHWDIAGVAIATVIAQGVSFISLVIYVNKKHPVFKFNIKTMRFHKDIFWKSMKIGMPGGVQHVFVALGWMGLQRIVNGFGSTVMAGYTAAIRVGPYAYMPAMSLSMALSSFTGQNIGAGKIDRVKKGYIITLAMGWVMAIIVGFIVVKFGANIAALFTNAKDITSVVPIAARELSIEGMFYVILFTMFITAGLLRGAGDTIPTMIFSFIALWCVRIPTAAILSKHIGTDGIWYAIPMGWTMGMILHLIYYFTGRWKHKNVIDK